MNTAVMDAMTMRAMTPDDGAGVLRIYQEGIDTGHATFETAAPDWDSWDAGHLQHSRIVAMKAGAMFGWAALSAVSKRPVYRGVAEISVYVAQAARGLKVGRRLMREVIASSERAGIWTLQAGIFPENKASMALHERAGFRTIGIRDRVGKMQHGPLAGQWRDVVLMERRSATVGVE